MNQPSEEELYNIISEGFVNGNISLQRILDRYHLIDKTEPIPVAVSADELKEFWMNSPDNESFYDQVSKAFDIYPKGTVARIRNYNDELEAEVDRLKGQQKPEATIYPMIEILADEYRFNRNTLTDLVGALAVEGNGEANKIIKAAEVKKPEAVGCGRLFRRDNLSHQQVCTKAYPCPDCQAKARIKDSEDRLKKVLEQTNPEAMGCGHRIHWDGVPVFCGKHWTCPDCQAKANHPEKPDSSKRVQLPDVPNWRTFEESPGNVYEDALYRFLQAVKAHLEGKDAN